MKYIRVYVETNYCLSYATGRNLRALELLERHAWRVAIPEFCLAEATRTFYFEIDSERGRYTEHAAKRLSEAARIGTDSATEFIKHQTDASSFEAAERNESEQRFREITSRVAREARLLHNRADWYNEQLAHFTKQKDLFDDAILDAVLTDAAAVPRAEGEMHMLFTENTKEFEQPSILKKLEDNGIYLATDFPSLIGQLDVDA